MRKANDKETVEIRKVKEVVAGRCWKAVWLRALKKTGEIFISFP